MPSGALSPYGAEVAALLQYADKQGKQGLEGASWAKALASYFLDTYPGGRQTGVLLGPAPLRRHHAT
jgi:hypothetical protein